MQDIEHRDCRCRHSCVSPSRRIVSFLALITQVEESKWYLSQLSPRQIAPGLLTTSAQSLLQGLSSGETSSLCLTLCRARGVGFIPPRGRLAAAASGD